MAGSGDPKPHGTARPDNPPAMMRPRGELLLVALPLGWGLLLVTLSLWRTTFSFLLPVLTAMSLVLVIWWSVLAIRIPGRRFRIGLALGAVMAALVVFRVPRRIAFIARMDVLNAEVQEALRHVEASDKNRSLPTWEQVGRCYVDSRGGVYIATERKRLLMYYLNWGFAWCPNPEGTPFGKAHYKLAHLYGDWYEFFAQDDW